MATMTDTDPTQVCEDILRNNKIYNVEHQILRSENAIIDRLLDRRIELVEAYTEIYEKLYQHQHGIKTFLGVLLSVAAFWNPERVSDARVARNRLKEVNGEIADIAEKLAVLLDERSEIHNSSGFASGTHYHIVDVIDAASRDNGFYQSYLQEELKPLSSRYDLKYWPSLAEIVRVLGQDAYFAGTDATNPLTKAATTGSRGSRADFFKALFASIEENRIAHHGFIARDFKLSDNSLASLTTCALGLGPDDPVDAAYVKRLRQRERDERRNR